EVTADTSSLLERALRQLAGIVAAERAMASADSSCTTQETSAGNPVSRLRDLGSAAVAALVCSARLQAARTPHTSRPAGSKGHTGKASHDAEGAEASGEDWVDMQALQRLWEGGAVEGRVLSWAAAVLYNLGVEWSRAGREGAAATAYQAAFAAARRRHLEAPSQEADPGDGSAAVADLAGKGKALAGCMQRLARPTEAQAVHAQVALQLAGCVRTSRALWRPFVHKAVQLHRARLVEGGGADLGACALFRSETLVLGDDHYRRAIGRVLEEELGEWEGADEAAAVAVQRWILRALLDGTSGCAPVYEKGGAESRPRARMLICRAHLVHETARRSAPTAAEEGAPAAAASEDGTSCSGQEGVLSCNTVCQRLLDNDGGMEGADNTQRGIMQVLQSVTADMHEAVELLTQVEEMEEAEVDHHALPSALCFLALLAHEMEPGSPKFAKHVHAALSRWLPLTHVEGALEDKDAVATAFNLLLAAAALLRLGSLALLHDDALAVLTWLKPAAGPMQRRLAACSAHRHVLCGPCAGPPAADGGDRGPEGRAQQLAAQAQVARQEGRLVDALVASREALRQRLGAHLHEQRRHRTAQGGADAEVGGAAAKLLAAEYLDSLQQVGDLLSITGSPEEAVKHLQEGQQLARRLHAVAQEAAFTLRLGDVHRRMHSWDACRRDLDEADALLSCLVVTPEPEAEGGESGASAAGAGERCHVCSSCTRLLLAQQRLVRGDLLRRQSQASEARAQYAAARLALAGHGTKEAEQSSDSCADADQEMRHAECSSRQSGEGRRRSTAAKKPPPADEEPGRGRAEGKQPRPARKGRSKPALPAEEPGGSSSSVASNPLDGADTSTSKARRLVVKEASAPKAVAAAGTQEAAGAGASWAVQGLTARLYLQEAKCLLAGGEASGHAAAQEHLAAGLAALGVSLDDLVQYASTDAREGACEEGKARGDLGATAHPLEEGLLLARYAAVQSSAGGCTAGVKPPRWSLQPAPRTLLAEPVGTAAPSSAKPRSRGRAAGAKPNAKAAQAIQGKGSGGCGEGEEPEAKRLQRERLLRRALHCCREAPGAARHVAAALAYHHGAEWSSPEEALFYLHEALGRTARQKHLLVVRGKQESSCRGEAVSPQQQQERTRNLEELARALVPPCAEGGARGPALQEALPAGYALCTLTLCAEAEAAGGSLQGGEGVPRPAEALLVTRATRGRPSVAVRIPLAGYRVLQAHVEGREPCGEPHTESALGDSLRELQELLGGAMPADGSDDGSSGSSSTGDAAKTEADRTEQKTRWWAHRIGMDRQLGELLRRVDEDVLGPWRCLLLGETGDEARGAAAEGAAQLLEEVCGPAPEGADMRMTQWRGSCGELLRLLLQAGDGAVSLEEYEAVAAVLLTLRPIPTDAPTSGQLSTGELGARIHAAAAKVAGRPPPRDGQEQAVEESTTVQKAAAKKAVRGAGRGRAARGQPPATSTKAEEGEDTGVAAVQEPEAVPFPMLLVLDAELAGMPWESTPALQRQQCCRLPSLAALHVHQASVRAQARGEQAAGAGGESGRVAAVEAHVDVRRTYYLLNPTGDLTTTQAQFEHWFAEEAGWSGAAGAKEVPSTEGLIRELEEHDLFVYFGHGGGERFVPPQALWQRDRCAATLLMGCSSGRLKALGDYEPLGVPLAYLAAGGVLVVANLWDVTDRDIDRFSSSVLHQWLGRPAPAPDAAPSSRTGEGAQKAGRTAWETSRARAAGKKGRGKEAAPEIDDTCSTPDVAGDGQPMCTAVSSARSVCRMPFLVGASPVCYGLPAIIHRSAT
ncbi:hypothetical protein CYMTET_18414, partial [Cymbomonas tetramitiformis]